MPPRRGCARCSTGSPTRRSTRCCATAWTAAPRSPARRRPHAVRRDSRPTAPTCCSPSGPAPCARTRARSRSPAAATSAATPDAIATALREAEEETGLEPSGRRPARRAAGAVHPAVGLRRHAGARALGAAERGARRRRRGDGHGRPRARSPQLADPANRLRIRHPSGYTGPAFIVSGLLVWGFTGGLLSALLDRGGWARPWDTARILDLDRAWRAARAGRQEVAGP